MDYKILNELIDDVDKYKAHKKPKNEKDEKGEQIYETLLEHTKRTEKYFDKFWQYLTAFTGDLAHLAVQ